MDKTAAPAAIGNPRVAADAMCGGLARWLRMLGVDTTFTPGIADADLVAHALLDNRTVVSSDNKLFERNVFVRRRLAGVRLPVGLSLDDQLEFVLRALPITPAFPRCASCNGELAPVPRGEVADEVPARTLIWRDTFYRCRDCRRVFWQGTHWRKIDQVIRRARALRSREPRC